MSQVAATAREMIPAVGQTVTLRCDGLLVNCRVLDVKLAWGRNRLLLRPLAGSGEQWVELSRVGVAMLDGSSALCVA